MNAKKELSEKLNEITVAVKCIMVHRGDGWDEDMTTFRLKVGYSPTDYDRFFDHLDFNYYSGFGCQELYGTVWFTDGSFMGRGEYDGSEWWEYRRTPKIPSELF